eukprot:CAMPEP_0202728656 /NCGR_PEP_ID=MMETSP1385-20130828/185736_1 /ASSEMBLY_ACC=CAM_ASM_000861 /TAXON_ID=933848 /ORGANISM="Elphidium margaritaceum" /LENGTH=551 /DNA_ID=CAMNT_0049394907 /DNA_START=83 /DNA_END=1739 /DNA_ORIENTATION=-
MTVVCPSSNSTQCNLKAMWPFSLHNSHVHCQGSHCNLTCNGIASCLNATIDGYHKLPATTTSDTPSVLSTGSIDIGCNDNAVSNYSNFACKNINVFCRPSSTTNETTTTFCKLRSVSVNTQNAPHTDLNFYAVNSWYDIDLSEYATQVQTSACQMHCGAHFNVSCAIANMSHDDSVTSISDWNCANDTSQCYVWYPTLAPSNGDDDDNDTNYDLIFGLCIGFFFLFLIIVCVVCYLKKDELHLFGEDDDDDEAAGGDAKRGKGKLHALANEAELDEKDELHLFGEDDDDDEAAGGDAKRGKGGLHALANEAELDTLKTPLSKSNNSALSQAKVWMMSAEDEDEDSESFQEYRRMMQHVFYSFAGYQPWAKKTGLYMHKKELQIFLDIVNITDDVDDVLRLIDQEVEDGKLTVNEWMQYFCEKRMNANVFVIKQHIEDQDTWALLCKAVRIIEKNDTDHSGKLEYAEFASFGAEIGLNTEETELLWNSMDTDQSGAVNIVELFEWFRLQLHQQTGRITQERQPSLLLQSSDFRDVGDFQSAVKINIENVASQ